MKIHQINLVKNVLKNVRNAQIMMYAQVVKETIGLVILPTVNVIMVILIMV